MDDPVEHPLQPGTLLVAGLRLADGIFDETVVLLLDQDTTGHLGVILNQVAPLDLGAVLPDWVPLASWPNRLFHGGPVAQDGAVCLAAPATFGEEPPGWQPLFSDIGLLHLDTPHELAEGAYRDLRIFAGYAGWAPGQLEAEVAHGAWYPVAAQHADVFDADPDTLWRRVLARQPGQLGWLSTWTSTPELN